MESKSPPRPQSSFSGLQGMTSVHSLGTGSSPLAAVTNCHKLNDLKQANLLS